MAKHRQLAVLDAPELRIAANAKASWMAARRQALERGVPIVVAQGLKIVKIFPDGHMQIVGRVPRWVRVKRAKKGSATWKAKPRS